MYILYNTDSFMRILCQCVVQLCSESRAKIIITIISLGQITTTMTVINRFLISSEI